MQNDINDNVQHSDDEMPNSLPDLSSLKTTNFVASAPISKVIQLSVWVSVAMKKVFKKNGMG